MKEADSKKSASFNLLKRIDKNYVLPIVHFELKFYRE